MEEEKSKDKERRKQWDLMQRWKDMIWSREDCSFGKIKERVEHRRMGSILCREKLPIGADGEYHPENPVKMAGEYISLGEFQEISETELKQWLGRK